MTSGSVIEVEALLLAEFDALDGCNWLTKTHPLQCICQWISNREFFVCNSLSRRILVRGNWTLKPSKNGITKFCEIGACLMGMLAQKSTRGCKWFITLYNSVESVPSLS